MLPIINDSKIIIHSIRTNSTLYDYMHEAIFMTLGYVIIKPSNITPYTTKYDRDGVNGLGR